MSRAELGFIYIKLKYVQSKVCKNWLAQCSYNDSNIIRLVASFRPLPPILLQRPLIHYYYISKLRPHCCGASYREYHILCLERDCVERIDIFYEKFVPSAQWSDKLHSRSEIQPRIASWCAFRGNTPPPSLGLFLIKKCHRAGLGYCIYGNKLESVKAKATIWPCQPRGNVATPAFIPLSKTLTSPWSHSKIRSYLPNNIRAIVARLIVSKSIHSRKLVHVYQNLYRRNCFSAWEGLTWDLERQ